MFEVTIKITGLESMAAALNNLAAAMAGSHGLTAQQPAAPVQPTAPVQQPVPAQQAAPTQQTPVQQVAPVQQPEVPVQQAASVQPAAPVQPAALVQPAAPVQQTPLQTSTISYTLDDLARAAMTLMDSGKQAELQQLLAQFGVEALPVLPPQHYGAFATALRGLGAQI